MRKRGPRPGSGEHADHMGKVSESGTSVEVKVVDLQYQTPIHSAPKGFEASTQRGMELGLKDTSTMSSEHQGVDLKS